MSPEYTIGPVGELKTKKTSASPKAFVAKVKDAHKRQDAKELLDLMERASGERPRMWGSAIVGFGSYHYKSERSRQEGDWPLTGFSPRAANLTLYIMPGFKKYAPLLKKLGKYKTSVGCLYVRRLDDIDRKVLFKLVKTSVRDMRKKYR